DNLNVRTIGSRARDAQSGARQNGLVLAIEFVAVAVALADLQLSVGLVGERAGLEFASPRPEPHGAAQFVNSPQLAQLVDHAVRCGRVELAGISRLRSEEHTSELQSRGHLVCRLLLEKKKIK